MLAYIVAEADGRFGWTVYREGRASLPLAFGFADTEGLARGDALITIAKIERARRTAGAIFTAARAARRGS